MRLLRVIIAVSFVLVAGTNAHGQLGLYGAPSMIPLPSVHSQSPPPAVYPAPAQVMATPIVANPAPYYGNPTPQPNPPYINPAYAGPAYAQAGYANMGHAHAGYANPAAAAPNYANPIYSTPSTAGLATPYGVLPVQGQMPAGQTYQQPNQLATTLQAGSQPTLTPPGPARVMPRPQAQPRYPTPEALPGQALNHGSVTQMLNQPPQFSPSDHLGSYAECGGSGHCGGAHASGGSSASCGSGAYGSRNFCAPVASCCPAWFGSVAALYMQRNASNRLWTTYETGNDPNQLPTDARTGWAAGGEVTVGRFFYHPCSIDCQPKFGIEATYWGLESLNGYSSQSMPGGTVSTPLNVSLIEFPDAGGPISGTFYFDNAAEHFVRRHNEIHNVEINFLGSPMLRGGLLANASGYDAACGAGYATGYAAGCGSSCDTGYGCGGCHAFSLGWQAGFRYFRFEENLLFGSLADGYSWGEAGGIYEAYLEDNVRNSLVGFQVGADMSYNLSPRWRFYLAPKFGIYNNHVEHYFALRRGDGMAAQPTAASGMTGTYPVSSAEDVVSFLSEIDLGLDWQVAPHWSLFAGYRVVFATGIALADHQVPHYLVDIPEIADIDTNGNLVLHGAFAGVTMRF